MAVERAGDRELVKSGAIPNELSQFLAQDACSLLVRGGAGTGKTALALTILRLLNARGRFLYLSTRTSTGHLLDYYPWLRGWLRIPPRMGKARAEGRLPAEIVDARLDEPSQVFERVTNELMDVRASMIVIDTWDSLREFEEVDSLTSNMRVLQAWCERAHSKLIVIKEDSLDTSLDSVVDGVVTLKQWEEDGRRLREMSISKLHGVNVETPSHLFTLKDGMFHAFQHYSEEDFFAVGRQPGRFGGAAHPSTGGYSTGYKELDSILGDGIPPGSVVNFELGPQVHSRTGLVLLAGTIAECTKAGHPVLLFPFQGLDEDFANGLVESSMPASRRTLVRQVWSPMGADGKSRSRKSEEKTAEEWVRFAQRQNHNGAVLAIMGSGQLTSNMDNPTQLEAFVKTVCSGKGAAVFVTRESDRALAQHLAIDGAVHIRIETMKGTLLVQPLRPASRFLAAEIQMAPDMAEVDLKPIV